MSTLRSTGYAPMRNLPINDVLLAAFDDAWDNFVVDHGRGPVPDLIMFNGAFTTTTAVFEIVEEE